MSDASFSAIYFIYLHLNKASIFYPTLFFTFQALNGFLMMMTQNGKLLYISDNAAEYLGHSMVSFIVVFSSYTIKPLPSQKSIVKFLCYLLNLIRLPNGVHIPSGFSTENNVAKINIINIRVRNEYEES